MSFDLPGLVLRVSVMYVYALVLVRLSGKQSVGNLTTMDFIMTTIIGDLFDDVLWQEVPLLSGLVALGTIILVHTLVCYASSRNDTVHRLVTSTPALIVHRGRLVIENLQRERLRQETVLSELRIQEEEHLRSVEEGRLEPNGQSSFLKTEECKEIRKKEIERFQWGKPYRP